MIRVISVNGDRKTAPTRGEAIKIARGTMRAPPKRKRIAHRFTEFPTKRRANLDALAEIFAALGSVGEATENQ